jgi:hypothetical protein
MTEEDAGAPSPSLIKDSRLRLVYVAGIALNLVALSGAVMAGERLFAVTFGIIIVYLSVRYRMTITS